MGVGADHTYRIYKDKLQLGLLAANTWSLGDGSKTVNSMLMEPWAAYSITPEWYLLTDMTITADWNATPSDRWVLPIGGGIGRTFNIGQQALNINLQAYWNAIKPDDGADWSMVFTFQMFFPK